MSSSQSQYRFSLLISIFLLTAHISICMTQNSSTPTNTSIPVATTTGTAVTTTEITLQAPTELKVVCNTVNKCTASWSSNASHHHVVVMRKNEVKFNTSVNATQQVFDVDPGTSYNVTVYSLRQAEDAITDQKSATKSFTSSPAQVTDVTIDEFGETWINASWSKPNGTVVSYKIYNNDTGNMIENTTLTTHNITSLEPGSLYNFNLVTVGDNNSISDGFAFTAGTTPSPPVGLTATEEFSTRKITLNWSHGEGVRDNYILTCNPDICRSIGSIDHTNDSIEVVGKWGESYIFTLIAVSNGVNSTPATHTFQLGLAIPQNFRLVATKNETEFSLTWDEVNANEAKFDGYIVERTTRSDSTPLPYPVAKGLTNYTVNETVPGQAYRYVVKTKIIDLNQTSNASNTQSYVVEPSAPVNVSLEQNPEAATNATVIWTDGLGVRRSNKPYTATVEGGNYSNFTINDNNLPLTGLTPDTIYTVVVTSWSQENLSDFKSKSADPFNFTTDEDQPSIVINVHATPDTNSTVIEWSPPKFKNGYIQRYVVRVSVLSTDSCISGSVIECNSNCPDNKTGAHYGNYNVSDCITPSTMTYSYKEDKISVELFGLHPFKEYNFTIQAVNSKTPSVYNETFRTLQSAPLTAPNLTLYNSTHNSLTLTWTLLNDSGGNITNYYIKYYSLDNPTDVTNITKERSEGVYEFSAVLTGLKPYTNYIVKIRAASKPNGTEAKGVWSRDYTFQTGEYFPEAPLFNSSNISDNAKNITLTWSPPNKPNGVIIEYQVVYQKINGGTPQQVRNKTGPPIVLTEGIDPYKNYTITLSARTNYSEAEKIWGENVSLRYETDQSNPGKVVSLKVINITSSSLTVEWREPTQTNGVIIDYKIRLHENGLLVDDPPGQKLNILTYKLTGLKPATSYIVEVAGQVERRDGNRLTGDYENVQDKTSDAPPKVRPVTRIFQAAELSSTSFRVNFPSINELFSEENGEITKYQIVVFKRGSTSDKVPKDAKLMTWGQIRQSDELSPNKPYTPIAIASVSGARKKRSTTPESFMLGAEKGCEDKADSAICNGPLDPVSNYCVYARAWTSAGSADSDCVIEAKTAQNNTGLIAGLVVAIVLLIVILIVLIILWRKQKLCCKESPKNCNDPGDSEGGDLVPIPPELRPETPPPNAVNIQHFMEHVQMMHRDQDFRFSGEYTRLRDKSPRHDQNAAVSNYNNSKNRWVDILPFDHSRVKLLPADEEEGSDYINANYVPGYTSRREYIATQGPLPGTIDHFWRMVWEQNVSMIVMLTQLMERGRRKCEQYWPDDIDEPCTYGDLTVTKKTESVLPEYMIRIFTVQHNDIQRTVKQFFVSFWPDFGCPDRTGSLLNLVQVVRSHLSSDSKGPMIIHCSAGVGRTGTYIAVDRLLQRIQEHDDIDIYGLVLEMREFRCRMVQTEDQYIYIHDCVRDALMAGMTPRFQPTISSQSGAQREDEPIYENTNNGSPDQISQKSVALEEKSEDQETGF